MATCKTKPPVPLEKVVQKDIIKHLDLLGFHVATKEWSFKSIKFFLEHSAPSGCRGVVWRCNTGARKSTYKGKTRFIRFNLPGTSDICGFLNDRGRALAIEVKRPGETMSDDQEAYQWLVKQCGGVAFPASSIEELESELRRFGVL